MRLDDFGQFILMLLLVHHLIRAVLGLWLECIKTGETRITRLDQLSRVVRLQGRIH